jgi:hypothetical protein
VQLVYLDTSHLGKLARKFPSTEQQMALATQLKSADTKLVYSFMHLVEITKHQDAKHIQELGDFMERLPHQWIKLSDERIKNEIEHAWESFLGNHHIPRLTFLENPTHIMPTTEHILEIRIILGQKKLSDFLLTLYNNDDLKKQDEKMKLKVSSWAKINAEIAQKPGWEKKVNNTFRKKLRSRINSSINTFVIEDSVLEKFTDYLISNPHLIKSYLPEFHILHMILKNPGKEFELSDIGDLEHASATGYVNVESADKKFKLALMKNLKILRNDAEVESFLKN